MSAKPYIRSFSGGEIAPLLYGRIDLAKYQSGLGKCFNFRVTPQGPIENRPGFQYVIRARQTGTFPVLIPFTFNSDQSFALEFGDGYIRFHTLGGVLLEGEVSITAISQANPAIFTRAAHLLSTGDWVQLNHIAGMTALNGRWAIVQVIDANNYTLTDLYGVPISTVGMPAYGGGGTAARVYQITSPYLAADMLDMHYVQSADVLTLAHPSYATRELRRQGIWNWTLTTPSFTPTMATPGTPSVVTGGPGGGTATQHTYAVTAVAADTLEESLASASVSVASDLTVTGNYNLLQTATVSGAIRYNVYKLQSGIFGYIGQTDGSTFRDENILPDVSKTPPLAFDPFAVGAIVAVPLLAGGTNYGGGQITSVAVTAPGTGYTTQPTIAASGGDGAAGATFTAVLAGGAITGITIVNPGAGYVAPTLSISGGGGTGATATATAAAVGTVTLSVVGGAGTGAVLEPVVVGGIIRSVRVVAGGRGYVAPVVSIAAGFGGSGASFGTPLITANDVNPQAVSYYDQRRVFGGSRIQPQSLWATRSGTESNMTFSIPSQDDDAIRARIVAREAQVVRHLVPLSDLLALTSGGVWRISASDGGALSPSTFSVKPQSYVGASNVQPVVTSTSVLYVQARGAHVREISYKWESQSYQADDASVMAPHLFDFRGIKQLAYETAPNQILWAVRDDGMMVGLTYQPEHEVKAWHQHKTSGSFRSVCAIPEGTEDGIYVVVERTANGQNQYYIERLHTRQFTTLAEAFFVDSGLTYQGPPATVISGLWHLEGRVVSILADGGVQTPQTVVNASVTLSSPASTVHIGLGYDCDAQSLPMTIEAMAAFGQGVAKNINQVFLRVYSSSPAIMAGPSFEKLSAYPARSVSDNYGAPPALKTGILQFKITPAWQDEGSLCVRQSAPLPLTLLSMTIEAATGG